MKITQNATIDHLRTKDAVYLRNFWYNAYYHPSRFAKGKGSRKYVMELANFASNLSTYLLCEQDIYKDIAEKCAESAQKILAKYGEEK